MDKISHITPRTVLLTQKVLSLVPSWQAREIGGFEYLSGGYSNENYRFERAGEGFVLRVPERVRPFVDRDHEAAFYRRPHRVRTAELIAFDTDSGCLITRFEPGVLLIDADVTLADVAGYLRALHAALPPSGRTYDPVRLARTYLAQGAPPAWIRELSERLVWTPPVTLPCHNDLNPWNVILPEAGPWVTLDWEWYGDSDPLFDLVTLHQGLGLDQAKLPELAAAYLGASADERRLDVCLAAFWMREYAWAHGERLHGNRRPEIDAQLSLAADRLRKYQSVKSSG